MVVIGALSVTLSVGMGFGFSFRLLLCPWGVVKVGYRTAYIAMLFRNSSSKSESSSTPGTTVGKSDNPLSSLWSGIVL